MALKPSIFHGESTPADDTSLKKGSEEARKIGVPEADSGVVDAYYARAPKAHSHHLQTADGEVSCAVWNVNDSTRAKYQEDDNKDETIK